ncbi:MULTISPECIES: ureidoglycolate lyase [unclassified Oceanobacter]|jgi:ureidoglycolate lyase|uniref:ureidoglycolate lyase n=1 Tax=unclassified Oceanobacter TaxID=2620260 RepID=UPI0026E41BDE|nr:MULTISPECIES: ureidoglycolate lyase [unclassified Oceanobacter]MDO6683075.1 ureidoglycolate lyase [Oceanobacter sp. 5_MG-2023]MDP2505882.1 ureidoglycolate lyase [Oceanobacter sp. 3_MG-2023]MDP2608362.1 ureidoglycolate lyase [Oceanobacter sp. 1_MG-2023]MDP2611457.1 ureidoglycolate lyase [Oceanobacter sp. 2_MG-2023]
MPVTLEPIPLTRAAFQAFGDVIETADRDHFAINDGYADRFHNLADLDLTEQQGKPLVSIFRARPRPRPIAVDMMERHPLSSQAFIPLCQTPFLVLVAPAGEPPHPDNLTLFRTNGAQGVNFHRGVWHFPLLVEKENQQFLIIDRGGEEKNCDLHYFADDIRGEIA